MSSSQNQAPVRVQNLEFRVMQVGVGQVSSIPSSIFHDPDGDTLTYTISNLPPGVNFQTSSDPAHAGIVVALPRLPFEQIVTLTATDPCGATATEEFRMQAVPHEAPYSQLNLPTQQLIASKFFSVTLPRDAFIDPQGSSLTYNVTGLPVGLTFDPQTMVISGTPREVFSYRPTITATDPDGNHNSDTIVMNVAGNQAPVLVNPATGIPDVSRNVGQSVDIDLKSFFRDPDRLPEDIISITTSDLPNGLQLTNGRITGHATDAGEYEITVVPRDGPTIGERVTFTLTVVQPNRPPEIGTRLGGQSGEVGEAISIPIPATSFRDADGDQLTLSVTGLPPGLTLQERSEGGHLISGMPTNAGVYRIVVTARDPDGGTAHQQFRFTVDESLDDFFGPVTPSRPPINGTNQDETLRGTNGDDEINGLGGDDRLWGLGGADKLNGGSGDDRLYFDGEDDVDGGLGEDTAVWRGSGALNAVTVSSKTIRVSASQQRLVGVEKVLGWNHDDTIRDTTNNGVEFYGVAGNDQLRGGGGADSLNGGSGNDRLYGNGGDDVLFGGDGDDHIRGGDGDDLIYGDAGTDHLYGEGGDDGFGAYGSEIIDGGAGTDTVVWLGTGGANIAIVSANPSTGSSGTQQRILNVEGIVGGAQRDVIVDLSNGGVTIYGRAGNDLIRGGSGEDSLRGEGGIDEIHGDAGNDQLVGGDGNDRLYGNTGADKLFGEGGDDHLYGGEGDDRLYGGDDIDRLYGGAGVDLLSGQGGNDILVGGAGRDYLFGGDGNDTFVVEAATSMAQGDFIRDFQRGNDKIQISGSPRLLGLRLDLDQDGQHDGVALVSWVSAGELRVYGLVQNLSELSNADFVQDDGSTFTTFEML